MPIRIPAIASRLFLICLVAQLALIMPLSAEPTFYVAATGSDAADGTIDQPFQSLARAQQAVRAANGAMTDDIVVYLRDGLHFLAEPLTLTPLDSGGNGHWVRYEAYPGESPVISGGMLIDGWTLHDAARDIWRAPARGVNTRQLYVEGRRAVRARSQGGLPGAVKTAAGYETTDLGMQHWNNITDLEFVFEVEWRQPRCPVRAIAGHLVSMQDPCWGHCNSWGAFSVDRPLYMENAYELLDEEGEWYLDRAEDVFYYKPLAGEQLVSARVIAPRLTTLVRGAGQLNNKVHHILFKGLTFSHATWLGPNEDLGWANVQGTLRKGDVAATMQMPGNLTFHAASNIAFSGNTFTRLGAVALEFLDGSQDNVINGNHFHDISGSAIQIGFFTRHHASSPTDYERGNQITNNAIHDIGVEYQGCPAITNFYTDSTLIAHNEICHIPYSGISNGWGFGLVDSEADPSISNNNTFSHNHIHHYMQRMNDGAGIYSLGWQPGLLIAHNYIHDAGTRLGDVKAGVYLDQGSRYAVVTQNVMHGQTFDLMVKGSDHQIRRNFSTSQHRQGGRLTRVVPIAWGVETWDIRDNIWFEEPEIAPASIIRQAGLQPDFASLAPHAPADDPTPPSPPDALTVTAVTEATIALAWSPASDDVAVTGYEIHADGVVAAATSALTATLTGFAPATTYELFVRARDAAGNRSEPSETVYARTLPASTNLALQAPVWGFKPGGQHVAFANDHDVWRAVDGDPTSYARPTVDYLWDLKVDLRRGETIDRIVVDFPVAPRNDQTLHATRYRIEASLDGASWQVLREVNNSVGGRQTFGLDPIATRFVRLVAVRPNGAGQAGGVMAIAELEIHRLPDPAPKTALKAWTMF